MYTLAFISVPFSLAGSANWLSNVSFKPQLAADVQQVFESAQTTEEDHDTRLVLPKKRHTELSDRQAGASEEHSRKKKKKKDRRHEPKKRSPSPRPSGLHTCMLL